MALSAYLELRNNLLSVLCEQSSHLTLHLIPSHGKMNPKKIFRYMFLDHFKIKQGMDSVIPGNQELNQVLTGLIPDT